MADLRYIQLDVGNRSLADADRRNDNLRLAVVRVNNRLTAEATTPFVWVLEDDIIPPDDACERLLRGFGPDVASVAGVYSSRYDSQPCVWNDRHRSIARKDSGIEDVFGNGFGCVLLRGGLLRQTVFRAPNDFDRTFYRQVHERGLIARVDWSVQCEHRNSEC